MIKYIQQGNILNSTADAVVNPINCVPGVLGKGLALQFSNKYLWLKEEHRLACLRGQIKIGRVFFHPIPDSSYPQYLISFPTKQHWKYPSEITYIEDGLRNLVMQLETIYTDVTSIAIPLLGSGLGGIDSKVSLSLIESTANQLPDILWEIYE